MKPLATFEGRNAIRVSGLAPTGGRAGYVMRIRPDLWRSSDGSRKRREGATAAEAARNHWGQEAADAVAALTGAP